MSYHTSPLGVVDVADIVECNVGTLSERLAGRDSERSILQVGETCWQLSIDEWLINGTLWSEAEGSGGWLVVDIIANDVESTTLRKTSSGASIGAKAPPE